MADSTFKVVGSDVLLRLLEDPDDARADSYGDSDWGGNELIPAVVVDVGPDAVEGVKKNATCMVYAYVRENAHLDESLIVASSWSIAAIVGG